jgi:hypothetical protein
MLGAGWRRREIEDSSYREKDAALILPEEDRTTAGIGSSVELTMPGFHEGVNACEGFRTLIGRDYNPRQDTYYFRRRVEAHPAATISAPQCTTTCDVCQADGCFDHHGAELYKMNTYHAVYIMPLVLDGVYFANWARNNQTPHKQCTTYIRTSQPMYRIFRLHFFSHEAQLARPCPSTHAVACASILTRPHRTITLANTGADPARSDTGSSRARRQATRSPRQGSPLCRGQIC